MKKFSYKVHKEDNDIILAISDSYLLGKNLKENDINFYVSHEFYNEDICNEEHIKKLIKTATIINVVGKNIINFMIGEKIIEKNKIIKIAGVPHAQVISIK